MIVKRYNEYTILIFKEFLLDSIKEWLLAVMKTEVEFSKKENYILLITFIKLATFKKELPMNATVVQHNCTVLKYLLRATAVYHIKCIERDPNLSNISVKEKVALQTKVLAFIPRDAIINLTFPFGRLNVFAADVAKYVVVLGLDSRFTPRRIVKRLDIDDASIFLSAWGTPSKVSGASDLVLLEKALEAHQQHHLEMHLLLHLEMCLEVYLLGLPSLNLPLVTS